MDSKEYYNQKLLNDMYHYGNIIKLKTYETESGYVIIKIFKYMGDIMWAEICDGEIISVEQLNDYRL